MWTVLAEHIWNFEFYGDSWPELNITLGSFEDVGQYKIMDQGIIRPATKHVSRTGLCKRGWRQFGLFKWTPA